MSFPRIARGWGSVLPISSDPRLELSSVAELSLFLSLLDAKDSDVWSQHVPGSPLFPTSQPVRGVLPLFGWGKAFPKDIPCLSHPGIAHLEPGSLTESQVSFIAPCLLSRSPLKMCHSTFSDCQP